MAVVAGVALVVGIVLASWLVWRSPLYPTRSSRRPAAAVAYVDEKPCARCHEAEFHAWMGSHHELAMQPVSDSTVLGDFNGVTFTRAGVKTRFFKKDGAFVVNTEGPDGALHDYEIRYTFGVDPLQQYLIEFPGGRLQALTIAWDTHRKRWFDLYPGQQFALDDPLRWTGRYQNWNLMCAACHSTNLQKGYDPKTDTYQTSWSEINVSCQACHGPGESHVAWANAAEASKSAKPPADAGSLGLTVDFRTGDSRYQVEACAACHARRAEITPKPTPGQPFLDHYRPVVLESGLYYADGQQLDEVYVYGSFLQSKMYHRGVRCSDCHDPHSLKLKAEGNAVCTRCHQPQPDPRFPTLTAKAYDAPSHHFHSPGSTGAQCVACHMPSKNYMIVHARQDHSLRVPRPDLSLTLGTPNACTQCHADRPARWAAERVAQWYPGGREGTPHYGETIAAARENSSSGASELIKMAGDTNQPAIVRATALDLLRNYGEAGTPAVVAGATDPNALVRAAAAEAIDLVAPARRLDAATPLLTDSIRLVRIAAARALASVPTTQFTAEQRRAFDAARTEFVEAQMAVADMPASHLNLGAFYQAEGQNDQAVGAYETSLRMDPYFLPARFNLANLFNQMGRNQDAERVLREGIARNPSEGELFYSLGLLLAEEHRLPEAAEALGKSAQLLPARGRVQYNYALALQQLGRKAEARAALLKAYQITPNDPEIVYTLALAYGNDKQWNQARHYAQLLATLIPGDPRPQQLLTEIQRQSGGK